MGYFPSESGAAVDARVLSANRAAFVAFATAEAAEAHLAARNGTLRPPGSALPVTLRRVAVDVGSRRKRREGVAAPPEGVWPPVPKPGPQYGEPSPKIYIGSIPAQYDEPAVRAIFSTVGAIKDIKILRQPDGRHKGSGFVTYHDIAATERAIHFIDGRYVLNAPDFPSQRPIYMKYASVGGGGGGARGGYPQGQRAAPGMGAMGAMGMAGGAHAGYAGYHQQYAAPQHAAAAAAYQHAYYGARTPRRARTRGRRAHAGAGAAGRRVPTRGRSRVLTRGRRVLTRGRRVPTRRSRRRTGVRAAAAGRRRRGVAAAAAAAGVLSPAATVSDVNASSDVQDEKISHTTH